MKQLFFATMWGVVKDAGGKFPLEKLPQILDSLKSLGYNGIEMPISFAMQYGIAEFEALMISKGMQFVAQVSPDMRCGAPCAARCAGVVEVFGVGG